LPLQVAAIYVFSNKNQSNYSSQIPRVIVFYKVKS
jgi:hypothetical protein